MFTKKDIRYSTSQITVSTILRWRNELQQLLSDIVFYYFFYYYNSLNWHWKKNEVLCLNDKEKWAYNHDDTIRWRKQTNILIYDYPKRKRIVMWNTSSYNPMKVFLTGDTRRTIICILCTDLRSVGCFWTRERWQQWVQSQSNMRKQLDSWDDAGISSLSLWPLWRDKIDENNIVEMQTNYIRRFHYIDFTYQRKMVTEHLSTFIVPFLNILHILQ